MCFIMRLLFSWMLFIKNDKISNSRDFIHFLQSMETDTIRGIYRSLEMTEETLTKHYVLVNINCGQFLSDICLLTSDFPYFITVFTACIEYRNLVR